MPLRSFHSGVKILGVIVTAILIVAACSKTNSEENSPTPLPATNPVNHQAPGPQIPDPVETAPQPTPQPQADATDLVVNGSILAHFSKLNGQKGLELFAQSWGLSTTDLVLQNNRVMTLADLRDRQNKLGDDAVVSVLNNSCVIRVPECKALQGGCSGKSDLFLDTMVNLNGNIHLTNEAASASQIKDRFGNSLALWDVSEEIQGEFTQNSPSSVRLIQCTFNQQDLTGDQITKITMHFIFDQHLQGLLKITPAHH